MDLGKTGRRSRCSCSSHGRLTLEYNDAISQVCRHDEVVFDDECCLLSVEDIPARHIGMSYKSTCTFCCAFTYLLMTLLAMIRCSESKKLGGNVVR